MDDSAQVHLSHLQVPLKLSHLRYLRTILRPYNTHHLPLRVLYYHIFISARSPHIQRDRYLSLTMDNTVHTMTPNNTHVPSTRLHYLRLVLNPSTGSPNLQYTFDDGSNNNRPLSRQRLTITTSLPTSLLFSKRPRRHRMMRTTSHTPDLGETITFPADSVQHQMTILTLVTHMLLSIPVLH